MTTATAHNVVGAHRGKLPTAPAAPLLAEVLLIVVAHATAAGSITVMLCWSLLIVTISASSPHAVENELVAGYGMVAKPDVCPPH